MRTSLAPHMIAHDPDPAGRALDRWAWRLIAFATLAGAAVRIAVLVTKWNKGLLLNDSLYYSSQARQNSQGRWFRDVLGGNPGAEHAPLTSLVLTPASLFPRWEFWQRATNTVIGIVTVPLLARLSWVMAGRRVAVVVACIAAVYANLWMNDALIMSETVSTITVVAALWTAVRHRRSPGARTALWCGVAVGLAALARSEVLLLAPLFALIGVRAAVLAHPRSSAAVRQWLLGAVVLVVAAVAMLVPWTLYNLGRFDAPVLVSTNAGGALLGANCADTYGGPSLGGWSVLCLGEPDRVGEDVAERSQRWQREAIDYANDHRSRLPIVAAARLLRAADLYGLDDLVRFDVGEERMRWASWTGIVSWWVLAPLAIVGWLRLPRAYRWITVSPAIAVVVTTVLFYGGHRLRSPLEPVVVICAAGAIVHVGVVRRWIDAAVAWLPS
jgi:hypothetical protein